MLSASDASPRMGSLRARQRRRAVFPFRDCAVTKRRAPSWNGNARPLGFARHGFVIMGETAMGVSEHTSKQYDAELESIRSRVLEMGGLVESQIRRALEGFATGDRALLDDVIATDHRVNAFEVSLDSACSHVIAKR